MHPDSHWTRSQESQSRYWGRADRTLDRLLLVLGAISLLLVVPMLWIWLVYGASSGPAVVYGGGVTLGAVTAGIGFAMIRILDGR